MPALESSLSRLFESPGVIGAALVDGVTGLTYAVAGDAGEVGDGAECSDFASLVADRLGAAGAEGELESVIVTSGRRHHVLHAVQRQGDPLLLATALDREQTNLALAIRQVGDFARAILG